MNAKTKWSIAGAAVLLLVGAWATLGQRGTAVQHALVTDTGLPPERVFFARDGKVSANEQQVRLELAVK